MAKGTKAKATYRPCGGLALMPDHDMRMLARMSARGWHLRGFSCGILYRFEQGEPHAYDYAVDLQRAFAEEARELYGLAGWEPVVLGPSWQILRAEAGTVPLYTDEDAEAETLSANRARWGAWSLAGGVAAAVLLALGARLSAQGNGVGSWICLVAAIAAIAGFVCSFFPFVASTVRLARARAER